MTSGLQLGHDTHTQLGIQLGILLKVTALEIGINEIDCIEPQIF